jgi:hypothetical protein
VKLTNSLHLVPMLGMNGAVLPLSSYVFLACTETTLHVICTTCQERLDFLSDTETAAEVWQCIYFLSIQITL